MIAAIMVFAGVGIIMLCGIYLNERIRINYANEFRQLKAAEMAFIEAQRRRMQESGKEFKNEIERITKERHPESNRHQRRVTALRYGSHIKSA